MRMSYRRTFSAAVIAAALCAGTALAAELASTTSAATLLGPDVKGDNWTVDANVRTDGFVRLYSVKTPYGDFQVNGTQRMKQRIVELRALQTLEKMSTSSTFTNALGKAGMAPIKFGRDLIVDPVETTGNVLSGIGKMFTSVTDTVSGNNKGRDSLFNRVSGITGAERELAFQMKVDPYTDFTPLRNGLNDVAKAAAGGGLTVNAAIMAIPGGAGVAVGATNTASDFAASIDSKTSDEVAKLVAAMLIKLGTPKADSDKFIANAFFSPNDQYAIADALTKVNAANSAQYIQAASVADSFDVAKFYRYRAELMAAQNVKLGTLKEFVTVADMALNHDNAGNLVAAFPFDNVEWTDSVSKSLTKLSDEVAKRGETKMHVFATTGAVSATARTELTKRGWTIVSLN